MTPMIQGAIVAKPEGDMIRFSYSTDGKIVEHVAPRHVVAGLVSALVKALAG